MKGTNIGRAMSILRKISIDHVKDWEYGEAMGAPMDELSGIIQRGYAKDMRIIWRLIKSITGLKPKQFVKEVERRTNARWIHFNMPETFIGGIRRF